MAYCAPGKIDHYKQYKSCFDKSTLIRIADMWNRFPSNLRIEKPEKLSLRKLWEAINERFMPMCGKNKETCWVEKLNLKNDPKVRNSFRPETPSEWLKDPNTWLTNFNIEDVMIQYEELYKDFKFLGVYPVDFRSTKYTNQCLYKETCDINFDEYLKKGIQHIGMVINLDRHNEPGSHWVALFLCIQPKMSSYGIYYYDSYADEPPKDVQEFMKDMEIQGNAYSKSLKLRRKFKNLYNQTRHQYGNSECGMFSMVFIVRWLHALSKKKRVELNNIVNPKMTDDDVFKLRQLFFRPV